MGSVLKRDLVIGVLVLSISWTAFSFTRWESIKRPTRPLPYPPEVQDRMAEIRLWELNAVGGALVFVATALVLLVRGRNRKPGRQRGFDVIPK
jgi:hypothetical protein